jgi:hypothetical protein
VLARMDQLQARGGGGGSGSGNDAKKPLSAEEVAELMKALAGALGLSELEYVPSAECACVCLSWSTYRVQSVHVCVSELEYVPSAECACVCVRAFVCVPCVESNLCA